MKKFGGLSTWIFIALFIGIAAGYALNISYPAPAQKSKKEALKQLTKELSNQPTPAAVELSSIVSNDSISENEKYDAALACINKTKNASTELSKYQKSIDVSETQNATLKKILEILSIFTDIFLRLIKMIIAPLVLATLVAGVAKLGDMKTVGRIGGKTMLWFISASFISLLLGALLVNLYQPGKSLQVPLPPEAMESGIDKAALTLKGFVVHIVPSSVIESMATNEILQIVIFALFFGTATAALGKKGEIIVKAMDALGHVMLRITSMVMYVAPFAVFAAMTSVVAKKGIGVLSSYALFIGEFYSGLLLLWIILLFVAFLIVGKRVVQLTARIKSPLLLAFSTASSEAAYPKLLEELERFGCRNRIVSFVLPLGYSFNLDGSMMYMTFASLFIAQSYGIDLSWADQAAMLLTLMVTSKGIAGVPRASLVVIAGTLATFGIPEAGLLLLLGVDHVLDMGRSATNVVGNAVAAVAVNRWEEKNYNEEEERD
jgi:Na+/H+-dicarboxylate symporter